MCLVEIFQQIVGGDNWAAAGEGLDTVDTDAMYSHTDTVYHLV